MLYDLGVAPMPRSPLESVFMLIANRRQYTEYLKTRVIMESALAPHAENGTEALQKVLDRYAKALMPYLDRAGTDKKEEEKATLDKWTNRGPMVVRPLWRAKEGARGGWKSALARGRRKVLELEEARRTGRLVRIG